MRLDELRAPASPTSRCARTAPVERARRRAPRSSGRSRTWSRTPAATGAAAIIVEASGARRPGTCSPSRTRAPGLAAEEAERAFERFWRGPGDRPGLRARARDRAGDGRAPRRPRVPSRARAFTIELPALRDLSESGGTTTARPSERIAVSYLRRALHPKPARHRRRRAAPSRSAGRRSPSPRAAAARRPPPKPLDQAIHDALAAQPPGRRDRPHHVHEQPLPVGRAARPGRLGAR